jgi:hypothetical protein
LESLGAAPRRRPGDLLREDIPRVPGIYVWFASADGRPVYVGSATGGAGLRHRIWAQHLNRRYLEGRSEKISAADEHQLEHAVLVRGRRCIDKSVFRRSIGRCHRLPPGQATVDFIRDYLVVAWVGLPDLTRLDILGLEGELVHVLAPEYNVDRRRYRAVNRRGTSTAA